MKDKDKDVVLGIDLGTSYSAGGALLGDNQLKLFSSESDRILIPSIVAIDPVTNNLTVGEHARDIMLVHPDRAVRQFKLSMGTEQKFKIGSYYMTPVELSSYILKAVKEQAEKNLGFEVNRCVITVPAYFGTQQRSDTLEAGRLAGLTVERLINEPTAAALAYGIEDVKEGYFLVFDLGGGTFDVSVVEIFEGAVIVRSTAGLGDTGGDNATEALSTYLRKELAIDDLSEEEEQRFYKICEFAKRRLSKEEKTVILFTSKDKTYRHDLTREEFLTSTQEAIFDKLLGPCKSAVIGSNLKREEIKGVLLVGGATQMYGIDDFIKEHLRIPVFKSLSPDLVVAQGASIQAAKYSENKKEKEVLLVDVLSHSLGIEVSQRNSFGEHVAGFFSPILHRNTVIPCSKYDLFNPINEDQDRIVFNIYEGDYRYCDNNRHLGNLVFKFHLQTLQEENHIPSVRATFTYDLNGVLEFEAALLQKNRLDIDETVKPISSLFEVHNSKKLTAKDKEEIQKRMEQIREKNLDQSRHRALLARADRILQDVFDAQKYEIANKMDELKHQIAESGDLINIEKAYKVLLNCCDNFDSDDSW